MDHVKHFYEKEWQLHDHEDGHDCGGGGGRRRRGGGGHDGYGHDVYYWLEHPKKSFYQNLRKEQLNLSLIG